MKSIWLHWLVANVAGAMTLVGWVILLDWLTSPPQFLMIVFFWTTILVCCSALGFGQQLILQAAGLPAARWAVATLGGCFAGGIFAWMAGSFTFEALRATQFRDFDTVIICSLLAASLAFGIVLGVVQFPALYGSNWWHFFWTLSSGLGMMAGAATIIVCRDRPFAPVIQAGIFGGAYGLITGSTLVLMIAKKNLRTGCSTASAEA